MKSAVMGEERRLERGRLFDENYWRQDLRLGQYDDVRALLDDDPERLTEVRSAFTGKRVLRILTEALGVPDRGPIKSLQERVSAHAVDAVHFLLVARFAPYKMSAAVSDIAEATLDASALDACRLDEERYDRLALLLHLYLHDPQTLVRVRGLNAWHRKGAAPMVLAERPGAAAEPLAGFLTEARVTGALNGASLGPGADGLVFEMVVPRRGGGHLLFLRRNLRPTYNWSRDGRRIHHGHEEELIILHFHDGGHRVRISSTSSDLPRRIADRLATVYFGQECHYVDDRPAVERSQVENLLAAITDPEDGRLPIVELLVENCPLAGRKRLMLSEDDKGDIIEAIDDFEARVGPLLDNIDDIARLKVRFNGNRISLFFPKKNGVRVVEYGDGRLDNNKCEAFVAFMLDEFGIEVRSTEKKGGRR